MISPSDQTVIRQRLKLLQNAGGSVNPVDVVGDARPADSPLHPFFEWDDRACGEEYRLQQARTLIATVRVEIVPVPPTRDVFVPAYVRDPRQLGNYREVSQVRSEEDQARLVAKDEWIRIRSALRRLNRLCRYFGLEDEVARIDTMAATLAARFEEAR